MKGKLHFIREDLSGGWFLAAGIVATLRLEQLLARHARFTELYGP